MSLLHLRGEIEREAYDTAQALRWSVLKEGRTSPLHLKHATQHQREETQALTIGSATHCAIFEPECFDARFVVYNEPKNKGEGARKRWQEFQEIHKDKTILDSAEYETAMRIASAVLQHPEARVLLRTGRAEIPLIWEHPSGLLCKSKLDWLTGAAELLDLKSARNIGPYWFPKQAWSLGYFHQKAFYQLAASFGTGAPVGEIPSFLLVVENTAPFDVGVLRVDEESLQLAHIEVDQLVAEFLACQETNQWPGQYPQLGTLRAPEWVFAIGDPEIEVL